MKNVVILLVTSLMLAGCFQSVQSLSPADVQSVQVPGAGSPWLVPGETAYEWTGCQMVEQSVSSDGSEAIFPFGFEMPVGGYTFFKQVNDDGTVGPVTTGKPCN